MRSRQALGLFSAILVLAFSAGCGGGSSSTSSSSGSSSGGGGTTSNPAVTVSISPATATVQTSMGIQFTATVANASNTAVTWQVNGIAGGNGTVGTISTTGLYSSPASPPSPPNVTITAVSQADSSKSATAQLTITSNSLASNTAELVVDAGPAALRNAGMVDGNLAFTTLTVCQPGSTSNCQTIDHVQVDTGSEGLRIVPSQLPFTLQNQTSGSNTIMECTQFADLSYIWGPVATADIHIGGEVAKSVPVQMVSNQTAPTACSQGQQTQITDVVSLGANAILGVGPFRQDCGGACALTGSSNPGFYYGCQGTTCNVTAEPVASQLQNPVWMFASDNNGVILQFPALTSNTQASLTGQMIFGIGTQSNNGLGSAQVLPVDPSTGNFAANFMGTLYNDFNGAGSGHGSSFLDSGSNGYFFLDSATLTNQFSISMPDCPSKGSAQGFYCPASLTPITVTVIGESSNGTPVGSSRTINFNVDNAVTLFNNNTATVFRDLGGPNSNSFDFGLPFFFGRTVFTAIEGQTTANGTGPYYAF